MKKINILIILSLVVISVCMLFLVRRGISLRSAPLIQPSVAEAGLTNVAASVIHRLHRSFEESRYLVLGIHPASEEEKNLLRMMAENYEKVFKISVNFLEDNGTLTPEVLAACARPCWVLTERTRAHGLSGNLNLVPAPYFSLSLVEFTGDENVSEVCDQQKRLSFDCLVPVSVREVHRRIKKPEQRYFFMRQYGEVDVFLFIQKKI